MLPQMTNSYRIINGRIIDPSVGNEITDDILIVEGVIAPSDSDVPDDLPILDASGLIIAPGFIDLHVHFREPGNDQAETIESGSLAAAAGGFTTVVTMPNTTPPTDNAESISITLKKARQAGHVSVLPCGCITEGQKGKTIAPLSDMARAGAVAFSDDGTTVVDYELMKDAMSQAKELGIPLLDHAQDPALAGKGVVYESEFAATLGLPLMPIKAETSMVERDIRLAEETGCAVHIQHVSCAESVELIRAAQSSQLPVTGEATPHHLALTINDIDPDNSSFKMNPPLGTEKDRDAIIEAIIDDTLLAFATDHAPHLRSDKQKGFLAAPFGVVGLETAIGVTYTSLVEAGHMTEMDWIKRWTEGPASVLGIACPSLKIGSSANITIMDLQATWTVKPHRFLSRSQNTPFEGSSLTGQPAYTFLQGRMTWGESGKWQVASGTDR
jgi:dihydroorotase